MRSPLITTLALTVLLGGCATIRDSAVNPANWFGRSQEDPAQTASAETANPLIPDRQGLFAARRAAREAIDLTTPIPQVTDLVVERVPGGAIIRATGLDLYTTSFNASLRPGAAGEVPQDGALVYVFRRELPEGARAGGAEAAREITVARFVSEQTLSGVRTIRVEAAQNARSVRR
jgi:hypothetical protein